jgi:hypothetical protein
MQNS